MDITSNNLLASIECPEIIEKLKPGQHFILQDFTNKQEFHKAMEEIILDGISKIESLACRQQVANAGLSQMHKYFPVDKVALLDLFLRDNIARIALEMPYSFCKNDLKYTGDFFIDTSTVVRICYPFSIAVKSKTTYSQYWQYSQEQSVRSSQSTPSHSINYAKKLKSAMKRILKKAIKLNQSPQPTPALQPPSPNFSDPSQYHHQYPYAASSYGPHIDSWYGYALNEIILWWAITEVKEDNGMVLYPDLFGKPLEYDTNFVNDPLPPGITLPKPKKFNMDSGSLLVINSDILHGTNLNISDATRIAIAPRVVLGTPKFNSNCKDFKSQQWASSKDIARGDFERIIKFPVEESFGVLYGGNQKPRLEKRISVTLNSPLTKEVPIALCPSDTLAVGEKMLVNFPKESIIISRTTDNLQAINAICPHMQVNLIDGFHDESQIYCPGHGVEFNWVDGKSKCDILKLQVYQAFDRHGQIFLNRTISSGSDR